MHPLFRNTAGLGAYLALWTILAGMLSALIRVSSDLNWSQAMSVAVPMCMFYAFACLTPWYLCRAFPLGSSGMTRLLINQLGAAILACALWIGLARLLAFAMDLGPLL